MPKSVEELRRMSERNRAELASRVDQLKDRISETTDDIRHKVSPEHIKAEVSDYVGRKTQSWLEGLKQQARDNPLQAIAAGVAVAVPTLRLARGISLPLLMIGAGCALTSKTARNRAIEAVAPAMERARGLADDAADSAWAVHGDVTDAVSAMQSQAAAAANTVQERASAAAGDVRASAAQTAGAIRGKLSGGMDTAKETIERARSTAKATAAATKEVAEAVPAKTRQVISDNAALIGGLGIAMGAILAAALPETEAESKVMGQPSDRVKQAAGEATQSGFEAVKEATMSAAEAATKSVTEADLGGHASRMTQNIADTFKDAADDVVSAAVNPSRNPNS
jgi:hypothetical protein